MSQHNFDILFENQGLLLLLDPRFYMISKTASHRFHADRKDDLGTVKAKIEELYLALIGACSTKFSTRFAEGIINGMDALVKGKCDLSQSTGLYKSLEAAASFQHCPKAFVLKALGETKGAELLDYFQRNKDFYLKMAGALSTWVSLMDSQSEDGASILLGQQLIAFAEVMQDENVMASVRKMLPLVASHLKDMRSKLVKMAKMAVSRDASSLVGFFSKLNDDQCLLNALLNVDHLGAITEPEGDDNTLCRVDFGKIYKVYFEKIALHDVEDKCQLDNGSMKVQVSTGVLCAGASLHHVLCHLLNVNGIVLKASKAKTMASMLKNEDASAGSVYEGCRLQHLVETQLGLYFELFLIWLWFRP